MCPLLAHTCATLLCLLHDVSTLAYWSRHRLEHMRAQMLPQLQPRRDERSCCRRRRASSASGTPPAAAEPPCRSCQPATPLVRWTPATRCPRSRHTAPAACAATHAARPATAALRRRQRTPGQSQPGARHGAGPPARPPAAASTTMRGMRTFRHGSPAPWTG